MAGKGFCNRRGTAARWDGPHNSELPRQPLRTLHHHELLGLYAEAPNRILHVPVLPEFLNELTLSGLTIGRSRVALQLRRYGSRTLANLPGIEGGAAEGADRAELSEGSVLPSRGIGRNFAREARRSP